MSTVCGRPQGGGFLAHVDACRQQGWGGQKPDFFGRHKWMAPYCSAGHFKNNCRPMLHKDDLLRNI